MPSQGWPGPQQSLERNTVHSSHSSRGGHTQGACQGTVSSESRHLGAQALALSWHCSYPASNLGRIPSALQALLCSAVMCGGHGLHIPFVVRIKGQGSVGSVWLMPGSRDPSVNASGGADQCHQQGRRGPRPLECRYIWQFLIQNWSATVSVSTECPGKRWQLASWAGGWPWQREQPACRTRGGHGHNPNNEQSPAWLVGEHVGGGGGGWQGRI